MSDEVKIQEVDAEFAGQKLKISGANLNTLFTVLGFLVGCMCLYALWNHTNDSRDAAKAFADAVREQTVAVKEQTSELRFQNCLALLKDSEQCRRLNSR